MSNDAKADVSVSLCMRGFLFQHQERMEAAQVTARGALLCTPVIYRCVCAQLRPRQGESLHCARTAHYF